MFLFCWINRKEARDFARRHYGLDRNDDHLAGAVAVTWMLAALALGALIVGTLLVLG